jgi:parallel beta-helix repeat protein
MNSSKTKKTFITFLLLLFGATNIYAADYYIAQTAAGLGDASSCANAKIYSWNWTSPTVNDGDTVHLCGTITSTLTIPKSGTSAGITVKFETGANLTSIAWGTGSGAAIYANGKSYITIDGGTNGYIAETKNGDPAAVCTAANPCSTHQDSTGINVVGGAHWEVKNLTVQNMYIHAYGGTVSQNTYGIYFAGTSYVNVHNNTINNCYYAITTFTVSSISNITMSNNTVSYTEAPFVVALGAGSGIDTVSINNNTVAFGNNWYESTGGNHIEIVHVWGAPTTHDAVTNLAIYNNTVSGDPTPLNTGCFYLEDQVVSPLIYNNVVSVVNNHLANGFVYEKAEPNYGCTGVGTPWTCCTGSTAGTCTTPGPIVLNNTFVQAAGGGALEFVSVDGVIAENNIISGTDDGVSFSGTTLTSNYNDFYLNGTQTHTFSANGGPALTYAQWQGYGYDANSITTQPPFISPSNFVLTSSILGTNLSTYFTTDITGATRSEWDMGAYEYSSGTTDTTPPAAPSGLSVS